MSFRTNKSYTRNHERTPSFRLSCAKVEWRWKHTRKYDLQDLFSCSALNPQKTRRVDHITQNVIVSKPEISPIANTLSNIPPFDRKTWEYLLTIILPEPVLLASGIMVISCPPIPAVQTVTFVCKVSPEDKAMLWGPISVIGFPLNISKFSFSSSFSFTISIIVGSQPGSTSF